MSQEFEIIAKTFQGFEEILAEEIQNLGGSNVEIIKRAVIFTGSKKTLYRCNYESRFALSFLVPIFSFDAKTPEDLYQGAQRINWSDFLKLNQTFSIHATINSETFNHSRYVVLKIKDAISDQFRDKYNERPSVNTENPDIKIQIHIYREEVTILLDSTGEPLYKRGYRKRAGEAHLNEVLAAGLLKLSNWDLKSPLLDPMCGSGTFLCEAGMMAAKIPASYYRKHFGFMLWNDFDEAVFKNVKAEADKQIQKSSTQLVGFDLDTRAVEITRLNIQFLKNYIQVSAAKADFLKMKPPFNEAFLIMNPPYGERLRNVSITDLYNEIGSVLKHQYSGWKAWIISSNAEALKNIGLKPSRKITVFNGPLECRFLGFELYAGSKKDQFANKN